MANDALAAIRKLEIGIRDNDASNSASTAREQDFGERIIDFVWPSEMNNSILGHGGHQPRYAAFFTPSPFFSRVARHGGCSVLC